MVDVGHHGQRAGVRQLVQGAIVGVVEALVGLLRVLSGVVGDNASQQLIQRVRDAFPVEGGHQGASSVSACLGGRG